MLGNMLSILGLAQNLQYRREDLYLKASALLDEVQMNTEAARSCIEFEVHRLGKICDSKSISREIALKNLLDMLPQCETVLNQVRDNRSNLQAHGASMEVVAELESWKSTSTQLISYTQNIALAIEDILSND